MSGRYFVFKRAIHGRRDEDLDELCAVYAPAEASARELLDAELKGLRDGLPDDADPDPSLKTSPPWDLIRDEDLDEPKVLTLYSTR